MALKYRMPVEDVLNRLTSEEQSRVSSFILKKIVNEENFNSEHFSFALSDFARSKLTEIGISLSPHSYQPHSHPVCKTLENNILYNILPSKIDDSFYFIGIKSSKLSFMKKRKKNLDNLITINRYVTSLDKFRYSNDFVVRDSDKVVGLERGISKNEKFSKSNTLKDLVPECIKIKCRNFFIHDELHYWSFSDMTSFLEATRPNMILATIVVPPELLIGATESLNPWCYKFEINKKDLLFFPDGRHESFYSQPLDSVKWLKLSHLELNNGDIYNVDLVFSSFAHHLICITKGDLIRQRHRYFSDFQAVSSKELMKLGGSIRHVIPIPAETIIKVYVYLRTLKKPDIQSAMAKLRQLVDDLNPVHIKFFEAFSKLVINSHSDDGLLVRHWIKNFTFLFQNMLPSSIAQLFKCYRDACLDKFINDLVPFYFRVDTEGVDYCTKLKIEFMSLKFDDHFINPMSTMQGDWDGSNSFIDLNFVELDSLSKLDSPDINDNLIGHSKDSVIASCNPSEIKKKQKKKELKIDPIVDFFTFFKESENVKFTGLSNVYDIKYAKRDHQGSEMHKKFYILDSCAFDTICEVVIEILEPWLWSADREALNILSQILNKMAKKVEPTFFRKLRNLIVDTVVFRLNSTNKEKVLKNLRKREGATFRNVNDWWFHCTNRVNQRFISFNSVSRHSGQYWVSFKKVLHSLILAKKNCDDKVNGEIFEQSESGKSLKWHFKNKRIFSLINGVFVDLGEVKVKFTTEDTFRVKAHPPESTPSKFEGEKVESELIIDEDLSLVERVQNLRSFLTSSVYGSSMLEDGENSIDDVNSIKCKDEDGTANFEGKGNKKSCSTNLEKEEGEKGIYENEKRKEVKQIEDVSTLEFNERRKSILSELGQERGKAQEDEFSMDLIKLEPVSYSFVENPNCEDSTFGNIIQDQLLFSVINIQGGITSTIDRVLERSEVTKIRGRDCFFFSHCDCVSYGHNQIIYKRNNWPQVFSQVLPNDGIDYNTCLLQVYEKGSSIGFHADDEKCYEDDPILTVNLKGKAKISFKSKFGVNKNEVCSFIVEGQTAFLMPGGFQRKYLHSVESLTHGRMSLTFRIQKKNIKGALIDHQCGLIFQKRLSGSIVYQELSGKLAYYHIFEPSENENQTLSYLTNLSYMLGLDIQTLKSAFLKRVVIWKMPDVHILTQQLNGEIDLNENFFAACSTVFGLDQTIFNSDSNKSFRICCESSSNAVKLFVLRNQSGIYSLCMPRNGCVIKAIAKALERREVDIIRVLSTEENCDLLKEISEGHGVDIENLESFFEVFSINARIQTKNGVIVMNGNGSKPRSFILDNNHIEFSQGSLGDVVSLNKDFSKKTVIFKDVLDECIVEVLQSCDSLSHEVDVELAQILSNSLYDGTTGVISDGFFSGKTKLIENYREMEFDYKRNVHCLVGVPGSGKTTFFKRKVFNKTSLRVVVVSPRRALLDQIKDDIIDAIAKSRKKEKKKRETLPKNFKLFTFEQFLQMGNRFTDSLVILDEMQLFPNGYLDLTCILLDKSNNILVTGDPLQSHYDSSKDRHLLSFRDDDLTKLLSGKKYSYNILSRRFSNSNFVGRLPFHLDESKLSSNEDHFLINSLEDLVDLPTNSIDAVLVASFEGKSTVHAYLGKDVSCLTFGESTGMNFDNVAIVCSIDSLRCDENRWLTALTRAKRNIYFVNDFCSGFKELANEFVGRHLQKFLSKTASVKDTIEKLPGDPTLKDNFGTKIGKDEEVKELKLSGDPWLKPLIFLGQQADIAEEAVASDLMMESSMKIHLPNTQLESIRSNWVDRLNSKEGREFRIGSELSNQFSDSHFKGKGLELTNAAERYEAIYPRHQGNDTVTFMMAVKKRLRFSNPSKEIRKFMSVKSSGRKFLNVFLERVPLNRVHEPSLMQEAISEFEEKKTSKPTATIENHSGRSEVDWARDQIFLFMKSQHCTKYANRFCNAKAGQTLACFHHAILCRFAPYIRYIEKKVFQALPKNYYIHSGKAIEELDKWVKENKFTGNCTESDYEAFDASQDHYIMSFEVELMKYLRLPSDLIEDYIYIKTHLGCKLGNFAIMRFTGEAGTFLFNTLANMLFTFMNYNLNGKESICFAGDDMCANTSLRKSFKFSETMSKIRLKAKVDVTDKPSFCGWQLTEHGVFKKPQLVLERMCIARERDNLHNCLDSYAIEVSFAYRLGELLNLYLDEEGMDNHYECVRFIVKKRHMLKSHIADLFTNYID
uniref:Replicase polyprotein n=1 Tax=Hibiscus chlorotic speck associated virus 2 TaxID=3143943 RepID=A0AAU7L1V7_9VIRU